MKCKGSIWLCISLYGGKGPFSYFGTKGGGKWGDYGDIHRETWSSTISTKYNDFKKQRNFKATQFDFLQWHIMNCCHL